MFNKLKEQYKMAKAQAKAFHEDESGDVIQFIALTALILIMLVGGWLVISPLIKNNFTNAEAQLEKVNQTTY